MSKTKRLFAVPASTCTTSQAKAASTTKTSIRIKVVIVARCMNIGLTIIIFDTNAPHRLDWST